MYQQFIVFFAVFQIFTFGYFGHTPEPAPAVKLDQPISDQPATILKSEPVKVKPLAPAITKPKAPTPVVRPNLPTNGNITVANLLALHNIARFDAGLPLFKPNSKLNQSAQAKLNDMVANNYFAHTSPTGLTGADFINQTGADYFLTGENLAQRGAVLSDAFKIMAAFMDSPTHKRNIMSPTFKEIGIATDGNYIVIHFGAPKQ